MKVSKYGVLGLTAALLALGQVPEASAADLLNRGHPTWKAHDSIVIVHNLERESRGTGVIVAERVREEGWIAVLTAQHVTHDSAFAYVNLPILEGNDLVRDRKRYGIDTAIRGRVLTEANTSDLSVVFLEIPHNERTNWRNVDAIDSATKDQCSTDELVYLVGDNFRVDPNTVFRGTSGRIESIDDCNTGFPEGSEWARFGSGNIRNIAAEVYPGFSGGPVLNRHGQLIGITFGGTGNRDNLPFPYAHAVSFERTEEFLSAVVFDVQIPILNRTSETVRYKVFFDQDDRIKWRLGLKEWSWVDPDECVVHHKQHSLEALRARTSRYPIAFDQEKAREGGRTRPIPWRIVSGHMSRSSSAKNLRLVRYISYADRSRSPLAGGCEVFPSVHSLVRNTQTGNHELEWGPLGR